MSPRVSALFTIRFRVPLGQTCSTFPPNSPINSRVLFTRKYFLLRKRNRAVFEELKSAYFKTSPNNSRETAILIEILKSGERRGLITPGDNQQRSYMISQIISRFEIKWCEMEKEKAQEEITQLFNLLFEGLKSKIEK